MIIKNMEGCGNTFILIDDYLSETLKKYNKETSDIIAEDQNNSNKFSILDKINILIAEQVSTASPVRPDGCIFAVATSEQYARLGNEKNGLMENDLFRMKYYDINRKTGKATPAKMCGNGLRCFAKYLNDQYEIGPNMKIKTDAGIKAAYISCHENTSTSSEQVEIELGQARDFCAVNESEQLYHVNTSIAHIVQILHCFKCGTGQYERYNKLRRRGRQIGHDRELLKRLKCADDSFQVNFATITGPNSIDTITYETGVEDFTKACGTGAAAAAYVVSEVKNIEFPIQVKMPGGILTIISKSTDKGRTLWLKGSAGYIG